MLDVPRAGWPRQDADVLGVLRVLEGLDRVLLGSVEGMGARLSCLLAPWVSHVAAVSWSADRARAPLHAHGDEEAVAGLRAPDLARLLEEVEPGVPARRRLTIAGEARPVLAVVAESGGERALLVLVLAQDDAAPERCDELVQRVWTLVDAQLAARARDAHPAELSVARAVAGERSRVAGRFGDEHGAVLTALLAVLREDGLDDRAARQVATDLTSRALVDLRERVGLEQRSGAEPADRAFARLEAELRPLARHGSATFSFAAPESHAPLPAHTAQGARAITRSAVLALLDQDDVSRLRIGWKLEDGLEVCVRDDGPGRVDAGALATFEAAARVEAVDGSIEVDSVPDWGTRVVVRLPLTVASPVPDDPLDKLNRREREVLDLLAEGHRNQDIAQALYISPNTVKFHIGHILRKLGVRTRGQAAALARGSLAPTA